jgi:hypothetical protein
VQRITRNLLERALGKFETPGANDE